MKEFQLYRRTQIAEGRELLPDETSWLEVERKGISVSQPDKELSSKEFVKGKVFRNPQNHDDQWYMNETYFNDNFEPLT